MTTHAPVEAHANVTDGRGPGVLSAERDEALFPVRPAALLALAWLSLSAAGGRAGAQGTVIEWPRIEISVAARRLWVVGEGGDTIFSGSVAVGTGKALRGEDRTWVFRTPTGATTVRSKEVAPVWIAPDWHYLELARDGGLAVVRLPYDDPVTLPDGRQVDVRGRIIGIVGTDSVFRELPAEGNIIIDGVLYVPPLGTRNREVPGELGPYRLLLANGVGLHGTRHKESIGKSATHGCIRLHDADVTWLYENIPVGTRVVIR